MEYNLLSACDILYFHGCSQQQCVTNVAESPLPPESGKVKWGHQTPEVCDLSDLSWSASGGTEILKEVPNPNTTQPSTIQQKMINDMC